MEIQDYLIAAIQNILILVNMPKDKKSKSNVQGGRKEIVHSTQRLIIYSYERFFSLLLMFSGLLTLGVFRLDDEK
jgi:hypothetical protein